jgi:hypothetical protein
MAYFVSSAESKPDVKLRQRQICAKARAHEHEYPIQFMAALANTMQLIAEVRNSTLS